MWLSPVGHDLPLVDAPLPVVAFEVESSWRTRKHIKGDYLNLFDVGASLGVIVLVGEGEDVEATRRFARTLVDRPGPRIVVWSEADVARLSQSEAQAPQVPTGSGSHDATADRAINGHVGKYRGLWAWLRDQPVDRLPMTFAEIEEIVGMPLPPSSRRHPAHWSGYEGSAVARAIHDAGWRASEVNLSAERLVFVRDEQP